MDIKFDKDSAMKRLHEILGGKGNIDNIDITFSSYSPSIYNINIWANNEIVTSSQFAFGGDYHFDADENVNKTLDVIDNIINDTEPEDFIEYPWIPEIGILTSEAKKIFGDRAEVSYGVDINNEKVLCLTVSSIQNLTVINTDADHTSPEFWEATHDAFERSTTGFMGALSAVLEIKDGGSIDTLSDSTVQLLNRGYKRKELWEPIVLTVFDVLNEPDKPEED